MMCSLYANKDILIFRRFVSLFRCGKPMLTSISLEWKTSFFYFSSFVFVGRANKDVNGK